MPVRYETGVLVTPDMARRLLAVNAENQRRLKPNKIVGMARDMKAGNWVEETGETIKIRTDGVFIDGQNRMQAVVEAGVPIRFDIAYDVDPRAQFVIDSGATRSFADAMSILHARNRVTASSIVRWWILWHLGYPTRSARVWPTISEQAETFRMHPEMFDAAAQRANDCTAHGLGSKAAAGMAFALFYSIDKEQAHAFFDQYVGGANLSDRSPVLALRNRIPRVVRLGKGKNHVNEQLALFIKAWNFWRTDTLIDKLQGTRGELTNTNFPKPK